MSGPSGKYVPDWDTLLQNLEEALDTTPKTRDADYKALVNSLDALNDEVKSGEDISKVVAMIVPLYKRVFDYPHWNLKQTVVFAFNHVWQAIGEQSLEYLLESQQPPNSHLLPLWLSNLSNSKREIRDATAQNFGVLSGVLGNQLLEHIHGSLEQVLAGVGDEWEVLEGWAMGLGYILANCADISQQNFDKVFEVLVGFANHQAFPSYSNYVRLHAIRALARVTANQLPMLATQGTVLRTIIHEHMGDPDMNVRKATASLALAWMRMQMAQEATEEGKANVVTEQLAELEKAVEGAESWHVRHGGAFAFKVICLDRTLVAHMPQDSVLALAQCLCTIIRNEHTESSEPMSVMCSANSTASSALVKLFVSLDAQAAQLPWWDATQFYQDHVHAEMMYTLGSPQPTLLDVGGTNLQLLMQRLRAFIQPYLPELIVLVYKNRFHAALPIRDSAMKTWKLAIKLDAAVADDEVAFLAQYADAIVQRLREQADSTNADVRETVFKGFQEVFELNQQLPESLNNRSAALEMLSLLEQGTLDESGGKNAEFPRVAAINALAAFIQATAPTFKEDMEFRTQLNAVLVPLNLKLFSDMSELIVQASLRTLQSMVVGYGIDQQTHDALYPLTAPVLVLTQSQMDDVKFTAIPVLAAMLGNLQAHLEAEPQLLGHILHGLRGPFGLCPGTNDEEEMRESVSQVLHMLGELRVLCQLDSFVDSVADVVLLVGQGLLPEENRDNMIIQSNCLALLLRLVRHPVFASWYADSAQTHPRAHAIVRHLVNMMLCLVSHGEDFEYEVDEDLLNPEVEFEGGEDEEDDDENDDDDEDDEDEDALEEVPHSQLYFTRLVAVVNILKPLLPLVAQGNAEAEGKLWAKVWGQLGKVLALEMEEETAMAYRVLIASLVHHDFVVPQEMVEQVGAGSPAYQEWRVNHAFQDVDTSAIVELNDIGRDSCTLEHHENGQLYELSLEEAAKHDEGSPLGRAGKQTAIRVLATSRPSDKALVDLVEEVATFVDVPDNDAEFEQEDDDMYQWLQSSHNVHLSVFSSQTDLLSVFKVIDHFFEHSDEAEEEENLDKWMQDMGLLSADVGGQAENALDQDKLAEMCILAHVASQGYFAVFSRRGELAANLVDFVSSADIKAVDADFFVWVCKALRALLVNLPSETVEASWIDRLLTRCAAKEFMDSFDGHAVIQLSFAVGAHLGNDDALRARYLQLLADVLANESMGECKKEVHRLLQDVCQGLEPLVLPNATAVDEKVHNEQFVES